MSGLERNGRDPSRIRRLRGLLRDAAFGPTPADGLLLPDVYFIRGDVGEAAALTEDSPGEHHLSRMGVARRAAFATVPAVWLLCRFRTPGGFVRAALVASTVAGWGVTPGILAAWLPPRAALRLLFPETPPAPRPRRPSGVRSRPRVGRSGSPAASPCPRRSASSTPSACCDRHAVTNQTCLSSPARPCPTASAFSSAGSSCCRNCRRAPAAGRCCGARSGGRTGRTATGPRAERKRNPTRRAGTAGTPTPRSRRTSPPRPACWGTSPGGTGRCRSRPGRPPGSPTCRSAGTPASRDRSSPPSTPGRASVSRRDRRCGIGCGSSPGGARRNPTAAPSSSRRPASSPRPTGTSPGGNWACCGR